MTDCLVTLYLLFRYLLLLLPPPLPILLLLALPLGEEYLSEDMSQKGAEWCRDENGENCNGNEFLCNEILVFKPLALLLCRVEDYR